MDQLNTIFDKMTKEFNFSDVVPASYAQIINLLIAGLYDDGIVLFLNLHASVPLKDESANLHILRYYTQVMLKKKEYQSIVNRLSDVIDCFQNAELYNNYAIALAFCGYLEEAIERLKQALDIKMNEQTLNNFNKLLKIANNRA